MLIKKLIFILFIYTHLLSHTCTMHDEPYTPYFRTLVEKNKIKDLITECIISYDENSKIQIVERRLYGNCHDYTFSSCMDLDDKTPLFLPIRSYFLDTHCLMDDVNILKYFTKTNSPQKGDIIVYSLKNEITHTGIVTEDGFIRSKWGCVTMIFKHPVFLVPISYGNTVSYYRPQIKGLELLQKVKTELCTVSNKKKKEYLNNVNTELIKCIKSMPPTYNCPTDQTNSVKSTNDILHFVKKDNDPTRYIIFKNNEELIKVNNVSTIEFLFNGSLSISSSPHKSKTSMRFGSKYYSDINRIVLSNEGDYCLLTLWNENMDTILINMKTKQEIDLKNLITVHSDEDIKQQSTDTLFPFPGYCFSFNARQELVVLWQGIENNWICDYLVIYNIYSKNNDINSDNIKDRISEFWFIYIINLENQTSNSKNYKCCLGPLETDIYALQWFQESRYKRTSDFSIEMHPKKQNICYILYDNKAAMFDFNTSKIIALFENVYINTINTILLFDKTDNEPAETIDTHKPMQTINTTDNEPAKTIDTNAYKIRILYILISLLLSFHHYTCL